MSQFVDTNVFLRLLTRDDPGKAERCFALFERARRGEIVLHTSETIVAEIVYVLSSRVTYRLPREEVATALRPILAIPRLRLEQKESVLRALDRWQVTNLDFEDCLAIEQVLRDDLDGIYSYDRGLDRVPGVRRLEP
jgi:predicted nucleic acid-binding protein